MSHNESSHIQFYEQSLNGRVKLWTGDMEIEYAALNQLRNLSDLPILAGHIAVMPDVHMGSPDKSTFGVQHEAA